jgi:hypothetical protein
MRAASKALLVSFFFSATLLARPSGAADLGADAVKSLLGGKMWKTEKMGQSNQLGSFEWKKDGMVCLRLGDNTSGKCDDSGTWRIDGARLCWEFTWWLKTYDMASACLGVAELGKGRYEAKMASGFKFMDFTVK